MGRIEEWGSGTLSEGIGEGDDSIWLNVPHSGHRLRPGLS